VTDSGRGYGQYCPIALGAEVFAERWTPLIVSNLSIGAHRFTDLLDGAPGIPRSVLASRLRRLERDGVVERRTRDRGPEYHLTESGHELAEVCLALGAWGARWREVRDEHHDPYLALWTLAHLIDAGTLPRRRVVVRFDLTDSKPERYWLVLTRDGHEICAHPPGFADDGVVVTDAASLIRWHTGALSLGHAQRSGGMTVAAPRWLERQLALWGRLSPFAGIRPATAGAHAAAGAAR
jgi:DNA-binding HxlR family transcriptional regulator